MHIVYSRTDKPVRYRTLIEHLDPALLVRIDALAYDPAFPLDDDAAQIGLPIAGLAATLCRIDPGSLPGVPYHATPHRQWSYLAGRLCAERALELVGSDPGGCVVHRADGSPGWPLGWTGSITHNAEAASAAAARQAGPFDLGIDAEQIADAKTCSDIVELCLDATECDLLGAVQERNQLATVLFCVKEAYYKAVFRSANRFIDFKEVRASTLDNHRGWIRLDPVSPSLSHLPIATARWTVRHGTVLSAVWPRLSLTARADAVEL